MRCDALGWEMRGAWRLAAGLLLFWFLILLYMSTSLYQNGEVTLEQTHRQLQKALEELDALKNQNQQLQQLASELRDIRVLTAGGKSGCKSAMALMRQRLAEANKRLEGVITEDVAARQRQQQQFPPQSKLGGNVSHFVRLLPFGLPSMAGDHQGAAPDAAHEWLRRKVQNGVVELGYYVQAQLGKLKNKVGAEHRALLGNIMADAADHQRTILNDMFNLSMSNGAGYWRQQESRKLGDLVQTRLRYLQNPKNCGSAKKVYCNLNKGCGYGCQLHHLVYCLIVAYGSERTLVIESRGWRYSSKGWEAYFLPLSETCVTKSGSSFQSWGPHSSIKDVQVVELPIVDSMNPRPAYMPLSIPEDLAPRLTRMHGMPIVWWIGQMVKYLVRPQPSMEEDMVDIEKKLKFKSPIVGVHVRRTDKIGTEAAFHNIEEYMVHVDQYYEVLSRRKKIEKRRVYLATDDPNLLKEAIAKYPNYEFLSENAFSKSAGLGSRYTDSSLRGIIFDIHFLSKTDYLVCTFSSQVCRVAYELMQTYHPDASAFFHSLDDIYYYGGQLGHHLLALEPHEPRQPNEIPLQPGDLLGIAGNHWDGYSKGKNRRLGRVGLFPSYKAVEKIDVAKMPTYPDADKER